MNRETISNMPMQERIAYFNGRLADGESYEDILAELGFDEEGGRSIRAIWLGPDQARQ